MESKAPRFFFVAHMNFESSKAWKNSTKKPKNEKALESQGFFFGGLEDRWVFPKIGVPQIINI